MLIVQNGMTRLSRPSRYLELTDYLGRLGHQTNRSRKYNFGERLTFANITAGQIIDLIERIFRIPESIVSIKPPSPDDIAHKINDRLKLLNTQIGKNYPAIIKGLTKLGVKVIDSLNSLNQEQKASLIQQFDSSLLISITSSKDASSANRSLFFREDLVPKQKEYEDKSQKRSLGENPAFYNNKLSFVVDYTDTSGEQRYGLVTLPRDFPRFFTIPPVGESDGNPIIVVPVEILAREALSKQNEEVIRSINNFYPFTTVMSFDLKGIEQRNPGKIDTVARRNQIETGNSSTHSVLSAGHTSEEAKKVIERHNAIALFGIEEGAIKIAGTSVKGVVRRNESKKILKEVYDFVQELNLKPKKTTVPETLKSFTEGFTVGNRNFSNLAEYYVIQEQAKQRMLAEIAKFNNVKELLKINDNGEVFFVDPTDQNSDERNQLITLVKNYISWELHRRSLRERFDGHVSQSGTFYVEIPEGTPDVIKNQIEQSLGLQGTNRIHGVAHPVRFTEFPRLDLEPTKKIKIDTPSRFKKSDIFAAIDNATLTKAGAVYRHPRASFDGTVLKFLDQASRDNDVTEIKMSIYRTASIKDDPIIEALVQAKKNGKKVIVFIETRARGSTGDNFMLRKYLRNCGIEVHTHAPDGTKIHAKFILVKRIKDGIAKIYAQVGTGNYNYKTARRYTDISLFTSDHALTTELDQLFDYLISPHEDADSLNFQPSTILVTQRNLKERLIQGINSQSKVGGKIIIKANELSHDEIITALEEAAYAGCRVHLLIRGASLIYPKRYENGGFIEVESHIGEVLEHDRVYWFGDTGNLKENPPIIYMGSCDPHQMKVEGGRRTEILVPVQGLDNIKKMMTFLNDYLRYNKSFYLKQEEGSPGLYSLTARVGHD